MVISTHKLRFRRIAIAILLLTLASWSHGGGVCKCTGGHAEMASSDKGCCTTTEADEAATDSAQKGGNHCIDMPELPAVYIINTICTALTYHSPPIAIALSPDSCPENPFYGSCQQAPIPANQVLVSLKSIILLI
jgi:hypothetical protein